MPAIRRHTVSASENRPVGAVTTGKVSSTIQCALKDREEAISRQRPVFGTVGGFDGASGKASGQQLWSAYVH
jgi:hypothetical protein